MGSKRTISRTVEFFLTAFGVWPGAPIFYRMFSVFLLGTTVLLHCWYIMMHFNLDNLFNLMDCLSSFLAFLKVTCNIIIFTLKYQKFNEILTTIMEDWDDCGNSDVALREVTNKAKLSSRISNGLILLHTFGGLAYVISILLIVIEVDVTDQSMDEIPFMMKMEYPFVINTQRKYRLVLVTQFIGVMLCTWGAGLFNGLFLTLTLHVGSQINILLYSLTAIGSKDIRKKDSFLTVMTKIIEKHKKIIILSENIENVFAPISLMKFLSNTTMICSLGFLIVTALDGPGAAEKILRSLTFFCVTNVEAFILCFAGEYMSNKSKEIGNAAYNSSWYDMNVKNSRLLLFIILRSQKQLQFTAGKMVVLSLECFTNIMKASGSYLSVLLAMR
ncbi:odorant receptor 13a-like isoform X2 [Monomorium pharaonis]|uniref:odorant receptor 13a-like isoform X2 n=1 Tax=Monomorium pharaonis TaxID=307658 RepID=UPI0017479557|nr:odorant receptor 13a-like isoform X2 [Monomorium pharaonis]